MYKSFHWNIRQGISVLEVLQQFVQKLQRFFSATESCGLTANILPGGQHYKFEALGEEM